MAMIRHRANSQNKVPTKLLYSSHSYDDVIYREELDHISANDSSLRVIHTLTRRQPQNWMSYERRIDRAMLSETAWQPAEKPIAFTCGPTALVESCMSTTWTRHSPLPAPLGRRLTARKDRTLRAPSCDPALGAARPAHRDQVRRQGVACHSR